MTTKNTSYTSIMRPIVSSFAIALIAVACSPGTDQNQLDKLKLERDSLKSARAEITERITTIEATISDQDTSRNIRITNVTTLNLAPQTFEHFFTVQGMVESDQNAQLYPEAAGKITSIKVSEGDKVSKGQVLLTIDSKIVSNQIDEVKSRLSLAEIVFKKQSSLWDQKIGSEIQFLEAKNNYESLKQNLEALQSQLALYSISAPFSGVIDEIFPKEGEMAAPQMPAFRLVNTDNMYIKSDVTERYLSSLKAGDKVNVSFPSIGITQSTTIERLGSFINPNNRTFKVRLGLKNEEGKLKPNLLAELKIRDYVADSAVVIAASLVQMTPTGEEFIYALEDNKAKKMAVTTGMTYNDQVEIISGLKGNETLIDKGARSIKDGDIVNVQN